MKKTNIFVLFVCFVLALSLVLVSCAEDVVNKEGIIALGATTKQSYGKGLDGSYGGFNEADYYWRYATTILDLSDYTGDPQVIEPVEGNGTDSESLGWWQSTTPTQGLADSSITYLAPDLQWKLYLYAYEDEECTKIVYKGFSDWFVPSKLSSDGAKVYVPMAFKDNAGQLGSITFALNGLDKDDTSSTNDKFYNWTTNTTLSSFDTPTVPIATGTDGNGWEVYSADNEYVTTTGLEPGLYQIEADYDSLGINYHIVDIVNVHSNLNTTVDGSINKRNYKTFTINYHNGKVINSKLELVTDTNVEYQGKEDSLKSGGSYTFEHELVLMTDCNWDGYEFLGWYTTDTGFTTETNSTLTSWKAEGYVRTNTDDLQSVYVKQGDNGIDNADVDFAVAYDLNVTETNGVGWKDPDVNYVIDLYARWRPLDVTLGATTRQADNISLWDADYKSFGDEGYVYVTINNGDTKVTGYTTYLDNYVIYTRPDGSALTPTDYDDISQKSDAYDNGAREVHYIAGFFTKGGVQILDNKGVLVGTNGVLNDTLALYIAPEDVKVENKDTQWYGVKKGQWHVYKWDTDKISGIPNGGTPADDAKVRQGGNTIRLYAKWTTQNIDEV